MEHWWVIFRFRQLCASLSKARFRLSNFLVLGIPYVLIVMARVTAHERRCFRACWRCVRQWAAIHALTFQEYPFPGAGYEFQSLALPRGFGSGFGWILRGHFLAQPLRRNVSEIFCINFWRTSPGIFLEDHSGHFLPTQKEGENEIREKRPAAPKYKIRETSAVLPKPGPSDKIITSV